MCVLAPGSDGPSPPEVSFSLPRADVVVDGAAVLESSWTAKFVRKVTGFGDATAQYIFDGDLVVGLKQSGLIRPGDLYVAHVKDST